VPTAADIGEPLAGIRVVDLSTSYAGPTATMYLADMGADVVKVERPDGGDDARAWGPPFLAGESAWFLSANRGKRSVCIDLRAAEGQQLLLRLLDTADVFVENLNPGKLAGVGLGPDAVRERCPGLIYCAISGFGLDGPDRDRPGYDLIAQARSGLMSVTGAKGGMPQRVSTALSDVVTGLLAAFTISAALVRRAGTGEES
jgi:crotonobetainyl-CoA:carnitine CoA-transferase CaiB-like acyl-CoA transferase